LTVLHRGAAAGGAVGGRAPVRLRRGPPGRRRRVPWRTRCWRAGTSPPAGRSCSGWATPG